MKKLLILAFFSSLLFSCGKKEIEKTIIAGKLHNDYKGPIELVSDKPYDYGWQDSAAVSGEVDENGVFNLSLQIEEPGLYQLNFGNSHLIWGVFLIPGDSLHIDIYDEKDNIFNGSGKIVKGNRFFEMFMRTFGDRDETFYQYAFNPESAKAFQYLDSINNAKMELLNQINKDAIPQIVQDYVYDYIRFSDAETKIYHVLLGKFWNRFPSDITNVDSILSFTDDKSYLEPKYPGSYAYLSYISRYSNLLGSKLRESDTSLKSLDYKEYYKVFLDLLNEELEGTAREVAIYDNLQSQTDWIDTPEQLEMIQGWLKKFKDNKWDKYLTKLLEDKINARLPFMPGKPAPDFTLPDTSGKMVSLKDFRGKIVYIDFWGTWCGPCIGEIPHLKEIEKKFHDNEDIVFLSIALDNDVEAWKKFIAAKELGGIQLFAEGAFGNKTPQDYAISGVPTFMLIDKEGKFISSSAERPSNPKLLEKLNEILGITKKID